MNSPTKTPTLKHTLLAVDQLLYFFLRDGFQTDYASYIQKQVREAIFDMGESTPELELSARDEEIKRLREALAYFVSVCDNSNPMKLVENIGKACDKAKAALNPNAGVKQAFPNGRF